MAAKPSRLAIGIDVGGTQIKAGLVSELGQVVHLVRIPTPTGAIAAEDVIEQIRRAGIMVRSGLSETAPRVEGVGITTPAFSVGPEWVQLLSSNIPVFEGLALREAMSEVFGPSVLWEYDTHAALLAEMRFGPAGAYERVLYVGIGTGVSCGVAVSGELVSHSFATCGNTGHVIVDPQGTRACTCGGRGCLETVLSGWALREAGIEAVTSGKSPYLAELYRKHGELNASDVSAAARHGDASARGVLESAGQSLGVALATLVHIYLPEAIFVGGGVAGAGNLLLDPARETMERLVSPTCLQRLQVFRVGVMGPDAGVIGAASSVLYRDGGLRRVRESG